MRYMLFAGDCYPCGGIWDFKGRFESMAKILEYIQNARYDIDWFNVYDIETSSIVPTPNLACADALTLQKWAKNIDDAA